MLAGKADMGTSPVSRSLAALSRRHHRRRQKRAGVAVNMWLAASQLVSRVAIVAKGEISGTRKLVRRHAPPSDFVTI